MAELLEFEESRKSSSGAESMLTCSEVELLTEERTHAGIVSPFQMFRERSSVRQGALSELKEKTDEYNMEPNPSMRRWTKWMVRSGTGLQ